MAKFANFEVHVEIEKLKIHVKGDREIAPEVATNVAHQISGIFEPAGLIEAPKDGHDGRRVLEATPTTPPRRTRRRSAAAVPAGGSAAPLTGRTTHPNGVHPSKPGNSGRKSCGYSS